MVITDEQAVVSDVADLSDVPLDDVDPAVLGEAIARLLGEAPVVPVAAFQSAI